METERLFQEKKGLPSSSGSGTRCLAAKAASRPSKTRRVGEPFLLEPLRRSGDVGWCYKECRNYSEPYQKNNPRWAQKERQMLEEKNWAAGGGRIQTH